MSDLVLLHGWGTHAGIWQQVCEQLSLPENTNLHAMDFPGYGSKVNQVFPSSLEALAEATLASAPAHGVWAGWSLGGMVAMQAMLMAPERIKAVFLICSTPKFVISENWNFGTDITHFENFSESLDADYSRNLRRFLLLQAGDSSRAKSLSLPIKKVIESAPQPTKDNLNAGLSLLRSVDLRQRLSENFMGESRLKIPIQVLSGSMDRICHPSASQWLSEHLGAPLTELRCGHCPLLSHPVDVAQGLKQILVRAKA